ncbi:hypothetical protein Cgig2_015520 [Carnegiea gigantea]|uniref:Uncharacterized protein n=1 Tax=Carnegiea gigantea TaxID=171969 RepID=A0A9Q1JM06_9CARY|nr:hypothetical protein Cgig2_015520 [Carnegiea gigantea]
MGHASTLLFTDFTKGRITEEFDEDVRNKTIEMDDSKEAPLAAKRLKEEGETSNSIQDSHSIICEMNVEELGESKSKGDGELESKCNDEKFIRISEAGLRSGGNPEKDHVIESSMEEVLYTTKEDDKKTITIGAISHMMAMGNQESERTNEF